MPPKPKDPPGRGRGRGRGPSNPQATLSRGSAPSRGSGRGRGVPEISSNRTHVARSKANVHPGQIQLDSQIKRRTKEEIQADNVRAEAEAAEVQQEAEAAERATAQKLAAAEDKLRREDMEYSMHASRPDLQVESTGWSSLSCEMIVKYSPSFPASPDSVDSERLFENDDSSEGGINIPEASIIGTESSNEVMDIDDEGSDQDDQDYIENEEEEDEEDEDVTFEEESNDEDDVQLYPEESAVRISNLI